MSCPLSDLCRKQTYLRQDRHLPLTRPQGFGSPLIMNGALEILRRERDEAAEQIRVLRTRIRDLESAIGVLEGQPVASRQGRGAGDLKISVLNKLKEAGAEGGTPKELADGFTREGRPTSDASVSSTLSRLKGETKVINRNGRWFAANAPSDSQAPVQAGNPLSRVPHWDEVDDDTPF
jgi:hypothetical protein